MGLRSRTKGKVFETTVRHAFERLGAVLPELVVRRSSQAERAHEADLIIEGPGVPDWLSGLWVECQHANNTDPAAKYEQAVHDSQIYVRKMARWRTPMVCWRKTATRTIWATAGLADLVALTGGDLNGSPEFPGGRMLVTAPLDEVLAALAARCPRACNFDTPRT